jgi:hypothetical protein
VFANHDQASNSLRTGYPTGDMIVTSALGHQFALLSQREIRLDEMFVVRFQRVDALRRTQRTQQTQK